MTWRDRVACSDTVMTIDYVERQSHGTKFVTKEAQACLALCESCPVLSDCHRWMMSSRLNQLVPGILAGTMPSQRYGNADDLDRELDRFDRSELV